MSEHICNAEHVRTNIYIYIRECGQQFIIYKFIYILIIYTAIYLYMTEHIYIHTAENKFRKY